MLRLYACITEQHDLRLVVLAALICLLSCFTALTLVGRAKKGAKFGQSAWLWAAAVVAGSGVWTTHFVAMLAFRPGIPIGYEPALTALSVFLAIAGIRLSLALRLRGANAIGGAACGLSVAVMHYTGMAAMQMQAIPQWDMGAVIASIVIGMIFGAASFKALKDFSWRPLLAAVSLLVLAIVGLHFTAMSAIVIVPDPTIPLPAHLVAPEWLAVAVAAVTALIIGLGLTGSIVDQHLASRSIREAERLRAYVAELETVKRDLEATTEHLATALEAAEAGNQAKSQFLAAMGHELRTPLNAIIGFSEILAAERMRRPDDASSEYAEGIRDSGKRLLAIINDVLEISSLDSGRLVLRDENVEIGDLIRESLHSVEIRAVESKLVLRTNIDSHLPILRADPSRLRQMLTNLLSNAVKFTPAGGSVTISSFRRGDRICISVKDTGIGIAEVDIPKAFDRFGQVDSNLNRRYEGTGLGLTLTKQLVELHGGVLDFESAVGVGTIATLVFPSERVVEARRAA